MDEYEVRRIEEMRNEVWIRFSKSRGSEDIKFALRTRYGVCSFEEMTNSQLASMSALLDKEAEAEEKEKNERLEAEGSN